MNGFPLTCFYLTILPLQKYKLPEGPIMKNALCIVVVAFLHGVRPERNKLKKMNFLENELIPPIIDHRPIIFWNVEKRSILGNDTCNFFAPFLRNLSWKMISSICKLHDCKIKFDTLLFVKHSLCNISIPKCVFQKWPCFGEILN